METRAFKNWWMLAINGLLALLFGLLLLAFTEAAIHTIIFWFGLVVLISGLLLAGLAIRNVRKDKGSVVIIMEAVATIVLGLIIVFFREQSLKIFLVMTGIWAVIMGIVQLVVYFLVRKSLNNHPLLAINAVLTILLGVILFVIPIPFIRFLVITVGVVACLLGLLMIYFSFRVRGVKLVPETPAVADADKQGAK